jgi:hypothetical protein
MFTNPTRRSRSARDARFRRLRDEAVQIGGSGAAETGIQ